MNIHEVITRSAEIRQKYDQLNTKNGVAWEGPDFMAGFVGDVGDLSKLIMAKQGLRGDQPADLDAQIAHELADCLWSICVLADKYGIDLETAFQTTMNELDARLDRV